MKRIKKYAVALIVMAAAIGMMGCKQEPKHVHSFGKWTVTKEATEEAEGLKERECSVCGYIDTDVIAKKEHEHTYSTKWSYDEEAHWHGATCKHTGLFIDWDWHTFEEWTITKEATEETEGSKERECSVCGYVEKDVVAKKEHVHGSKTTWTTTATTHKETYDCCGVVKTAETAHIWNHSDYQYDSESGKDIKNCTVCGYVDKKTHVHKEDSGTFTAPTCMTKGGTVFKCSGCGANLRKENIIEALGWCESTIDAENYKKATTSSKYIYFGVFPRTVLASDSGISVDEKESVTMGANTYYKGSDGEWYAKVKENCYWPSGYLYTDGTTAKQYEVSSIRYFKVEPIKWKVLITDYNGSKNALLLAEEILTAHVPYYNYNSENYVRTVGDDTSIYSSNYKYSQIRAYLNGIDYYYDTSSNETTKKTDYTEKGFLQTAFTTSAQNLIAVTTVINDGTSTSDATGKVIKADGSNPYYTDNNICDNTKDKIFLLSEQEVTTTDYGFDGYKESGDGNSRIRFPTDYAKANYAYRNSNYSSLGGHWWLRSPFYNYRYLAYYVDSDGKCSSSKIVWHQEIGVVPALTISLQ